MSASDKMRNNIAKDLRAIEDMHTRLRLEAVYKFADKENPGGSPLMMDGPAANIRKWEAIYETVEGADYASERLRKNATAYVHDQTGELHPLIVLASWEDVLRDELGTTNDCRATITNAASFIRACIPWMFDENQEGRINFIAANKLATELTACRNMLENLLHEGDREDTGVPCMRCNRPLDRVRHRHPNATDIPDTWACKPCNERSTMDQYNLAVRNDYLRSADRLTASDMLEAYRIKPGTLLVWANRGHVTKRGKDDSGRRLYDVKQALTMRDGTMEVSA